VYSTDSPYYNDKGLLSVIHSWVKTSVDTYDDEVIFEMICEETVEKFRQLILLLFLGE
jgi:hypothetical protein